MTNRDGRFCWYELMTTDAEAAERFYATVVGWEARPVDGMAYTVLLAGDAPAAGAMVLPEDAQAQGARPAWLGYVAVEDVDEVARRVTAAGGTVHRAPADIPGIGRFAVVGDPQGAAFVLFRDAGQGAAAAVSSGPGSTGWHELVTEDAPAAFAFYADLFGWTKAGEVDMGPMGTYQLFATGRDACGGMMNKPPGVPVPFWTFYFTVRSVAAAVERLVHAGGSVVNGPHQVPGGAWVVRALDPQGAVFALTSPGA